MADVAEQVARAVRGHPPRQDSLLPILHALVEDAGYVDDAAVPHLAAALNISRAEVYGVITFYHDFRRVAAGKHIVKLCRAEACQARGGAAVEALAVARLGVAMGATRADGQVTLEPVYCLGLCAVGPGALVDGAPVARLDRAGIERIAVGIGA